jgi:hypothetical protein
MLPANHGDCLWLEYGSARKPHRVLIDGGPEYAFPEIESRLPDGKCHFELLVITHVDSDHIGGVLKLLTHLPDGVTFGDVWFNGWDHLPTEPDELGPAQGEMISAVIKRRGLPWNEAFDRKAVVVPKSGRLPRKKLPGGLALTLLSPTVEDLRRLVPKWEEEVKKAGIERGSQRDAMRLLAEREQLPDDLLGEEGPPDPARDSTQAFVSDRSEANGSSIVLLAEHNGKRALLCGDAYPSLVLRGLSRIADGGRLDVDAVKLSHHGSKKNTNTEELESLTCGKYLVSTNGRMYKHPDNAAISRAVVYGGDSPTLYFNYRTEKTERWGGKRLREQYGYGAVFPPEGETGLSVDL